MNISVNYYRRSSPAYTYEVIRTHGGPVPGLAENLYAGDYEKTWPPGSPFTPPREPLTDFYQRHGHDLLVDAGALAGATDGNPIVGLSIKQGVVYHDFEAPTSKVGTDALGFRADGTAKVYSSRFGDSMATVLANGVTEAFCFGPALVIEGVPQDLEANSQWGDFNTQDSGRVLLGVTQEGDIVVVLVHGKSGVYGIKGNECVNVMVRHGCHQAVMLDGGGSTSALVNGEYAHISSDDSGVRPSQGCLAIRARVTNQADTGWVDLAYVNGYSYGSDPLRRLQARRVGEQVTFRGRAVGSSAIPTNWNTVATLPSEFAPKIPAVGVGSSNTGVPFQLSITTGSTSVQVKPNAAVANVDFGGLSYRLL